MYNTTFVIVFYLFSVPLAILIFMKTNILLLQYFAHNTMKTLYIYIYIENKTYTVTFFVYFLNCITWINVEKIKFIAFINFNRGSQNMFNYICKQLILGSALSAQEWAEPTQPHTYLRITSMMRMRPTDNYNAIICFIGDK